jgi:hypothetical protein
MAAEPSGFISQLDYRGTILFLLEDLEDVGRTSELAESDLDALRAVADWISTFVVSLMRISAGPTRTCTTAVTDTCRRPARRR